ncbi:hypothetical protein [Methanobacterium ferruginis]|uniref:hypothetical protein n=1 Tax=Methanobacterium ferruginis TaxID=710191 RepID=UPI00257329BF|nr:hypothetical protein [Methanobacterium ferruginis]BDZ68557.1 hypothetical protein GCM10025860_20050 [Methanobacterium ferruginis]
MESIIKQPNIIYENNPRQVLLILGMQYDEIYSKILQLQPGTQQYEDLKTQGQENIQAREKILSNLLLGYSDLEVKLW